MILISCKDVSLSYENVTVLRNASFDVEEGDFLCIVGPNGSGKSTMIKALCGLKTPSAGTVERNIPDGAAGYLPQQTEVQRNFPAGVLEVVMSGLLNKKKTPFFTAKDRAAARKALEELGVGDLEGKCFAELSGGQRQKILLARALCAAGGLIVLDEPTTGLDPTAREEFYSLIDKIHDGGTAVVMVSHDIRTALKHSNKILHLDTGVGYFGPTDGYMQSEIYKNFNKQ